MADLSTLPSVIARLRRLIAGLDGAFVERETHARLTLLALIAGHHVLLLGPPGTAKSQLARAVCAAFSDARYFEYLLTRFTHPDELFGPVSIPGLKDEDYRRVTEGFLPDAHVAFIDEIFKANSAILNSLLSLVNERVFHHGRHRDHVPLIGLIGASNESPDPEGGLGALHDRFLVRLAVAPVDDEQGFLQVALGALAPFTPDAADRLTLADLAIVRDAARAVTVPERVRAQLLAIRAELAEAGVPASDRRFRHALDLLRVAAVTSGRGEVGSVELVLLQHCFGDPAETAMAVVPIIRRALEALVQPPSSQHVAAAWEAFSADEDDPLADGGGLDRAISSRLADLDRFETALVHAVAALDVERDQVAAAVEASPWMAGLPPRLMAGFIGARRQLARFARGLEAYRERLAAFDLFGEVVPQVRRAQFASVGHLRPSYDDGAVPLWIARPGDRSDDWLPLSEEGVLLADQRAAIAGAVQRDLIDATMARGQAITDEVRWERAVTAVVLDNARLFALLSREGAAHDPALFPELAQARGGAAALEALARWLRGAEVRRLPSPPPLDG